MPPRGKPPPIPKPATPSTIQASVDTSGAQVAAHLAFNAFEVLPHPLGKLLRVSYLFNRSAESDTRSIVVTTEGIEHLRATASEFISQFGQEISGGMLGSSEKPTGRGPAPFLSNFVQLSVSGECAETSLYLIPVRSIAMLGLQKTAGGSPTLSATQVVLLYSDIETQIRLVLELFTSGK